MKEVRRPGLPGYFHDPTDDSNAVVNEILEHAAEAA
jgi:hypothetical protein